MPRETCAACHDPVSASKLCRVVIDGRVVALCRTHAGRVAALRPETFEEMRALFKEAETESVPNPQRSMISRRQPDDRRAFPPRPEGRRMEGGRRTTDRAEAK